MNNSGHLIFNDEIKTILLGLKNDTVDLNVVRDFAAAENLLPKQEFHITIIGTETGKKLLSGNVDFTQVKELAESIDWAFAFDQEFYFITKEYPEEQRSSIIQTAHLPSLEYFYEQLNKLAGQDFPLPFPHLTLFTNSTKEENHLRGIGIYSKEDMDQLSPKLLQVAK